MKNKDVTPEQLIKTIKEMNMTEEERLKLRAEELGESFGKIIGGFVATAVLSTIIWALLVYAIGLSVTWWQVTGAFLIYNIIKNSIANAIRG